MWASWGQSRSKPPYNILLLLLLLWWHFTDGGQINYIHIYDNKITFDTLKKDVHIVDVKESILLIAGEIGCVC